MTAPKLLPCPFCGNKYPIASDITNYGCSVECKECAAQSAIQDSMSDAIAAWNKRTP